MNPPTSGKKPSHAGANPTRTSARNHRGSRAATSRSKSRKNGREELARTIATKSYLAPREKGEHTGGNPTHTTAMGHKEARNSHFPKQNSREWQRKARAHDSD